MKSISDIRNEYERNKLVRASILDGMDLEEVQRKYDVKSSFVRRLSKESGFLEVQSKLEERMDSVLKLAEDFKDGMTLEDLSEHYGMTRQNVSRILKIAEVKRSEGGVSKLKEKRMKKLKEYYEEGYTLEKICEKLDLEEEMVRNYAYELGLTLNSETKERVTKLVDDILKMREDGKTQSTISKVLGVSQSYVSKILLTNDERTFKSYEEYEERDRKVKMMDDSGKEIKEIMKVMGLSESNVRRILYKFKDKEKENVKDISKSRIKNK